MAHLGHATWKCIIIEMCMNSAKRTPKTRATHDADQSGRLIERCAIGVGRLRFGGHPGHFSGIRLESIAASCAWRFAPVFRNTDFS